MTSNRIETRIESLLAAGEWESAEKVVAKQLAKAPDDHWLWSRLFGARYERRDYQGALEAAEKALAIVPDCPLALWSYAGAVEMLGRTKDAVKVYLQLIRRGAEELKQPDEDANECWEGADWTARPGGGLHLSHRRLPGEAGPAGRGGRVVQPLPEPFAVRNAGHIFP